MSSPPESADAIQTAGPELASVMADIHRAAFPPDETWSRDVMDMQLRLASVFGLIHSRGGMILARVAADEAEILTLAVLPEARRTGIGGALLAAAMRRAAEGGAGTVFLEVAVDNAPARALYAAHGFTEAGLRRRYYANGTDALILRSTSPVAADRS